MLTCPKVLVVAVLAAALCAAPAQAAGHPDQGFGEQGREALALDLGTRTDAALAPDGSLFIANSQYVSHILRGGQLDANFGNGGLAAIEAPERAEFRLSDIAVDGAGRPLVFGAAVWPGAESPPTTLYPPEPPTSAMARRFQPDGEPDPSFSSSGRLVTDFGLTSPFPTADGSATEPRPFAVIEQARLDRRERIVLAVSKTGYGRGVPAQARLVVRLGRNGSVDSSFGRSGVAAVAGNASAMGMVVDQRGVITLAGSPPFDSKLVVNRFQPNGRPDSGLGPRGQRVYGRGGSVSAVAANRFGGIAVLGSAEGGQQTVFRLRPDGEPVRGFGDAGLRLLGPKQGDRSQLLLDRRGRVVTLGARRDIEDGTSVQAIERLLPSGSIDRDFGRHGTLLTNFEPFSYGEPSAILFSGPRLLTVASGRADSGAGVVLLARYALE